MHPSLKRALAAAHMLAQMCMVLDHRQHDRNRVVAAAERHGMEKLGSGNWSTAFAFDGDSHVVKVCFDAETDCSLTYMAWCRANQHLPHVPKVYFLQRYKSGVYIAVLDRLTSMSGETQDRDYKEARDVVYGSDAAIRSSVGETGKIIREFFSGVSDFDMHTGNVMRDEHGSLVFTDPLAHISSADIKKGMDRAYGVHQAAA